MYGLGPVDSEKTLQGLSKYIHSEILKKPNVFQIHIQCKHLNKQQILRKGKKTNNITYQIIMLRNTNPNLNIFYMNNCIAVSNLNKKN